MVLTVVTGIALVGTACIVGIVATATGAGGVEATGILTEHGVEYLELL
jgi:hypothetical protein